MAAQVSKPLHDRIAELEALLKAARETIALCMAGSIPRTQVTLQGGAGPSGGPQDPELARLQVLVAEKVKEMALKEKDLADPRIQLESSQYMVNTFWQYIDALQFI